MFAMPSVVVWIWITAPHYCYASFPFWERELFASIKCVRFQCCWETLECVSVGNWIQKQLKLFARNKCCKWNGNHCNSVSLWLGPHWNWIQGYLRLSGDIILTGWKALQQGRQCEWSLQSLFLSLKKHVGDDEFRINLASKSKPEQQKLARFSIIF